MIEPKRKFRGLEIAMDNLRIEEHLLPEGMTLDNFPQNNLPYFKKYGFKVSEVFSSLYEQANGIKSDKYIPASLYFYYISPYLMNMNLTAAYVDKNAYSVHFPEVKQPATILKNINGKFYNSLMGGYLPPNEAVNLLRKRPRYIIKPALESGRGRDVMMIDTPKTSEEVECLLNYFGSDFIVQEVVKQHPVLSKLNPTSLNTCRVYTYLPIGEHNHVILGAAVRFGGKGAFRDNACTGGGFCKIHPDGTVSDEIKQFRFLGRRSLREEKGIEQMKFPSFEKVKSLCLDLHHSLPYMDLVGWDIAIDEIGEPIMIELNQYPDCEFIQLFNGPMFGEYTDALMDAIKDNTTDFITVAKRSFPRLSQKHNYNFEIGKPHSI